MSILSTFYDTSAGTPASLVTEVKWAKAHPHIGASEYGVDGPGDFKVTAHPSTPYAVNVAAGKAWGHGVLDESGDVVTVVCDAPAAGVTRWDLITIRRDWTPLAGGPTSVTKVAGGTSKEIPAARENTPGTLDDQPLYLAKWVGGQTQPLELVDLRVWAGNGGMFARDDLVRTYLKRIGSRVKIAGMVWSYEILANDLVGWINEDGSGPWVNLVIEPGWQIVGGGINPRARLVGRGAFVHAQAELVYPPGQPQEGWVFAKFPGGMQPQEATYVAGTTNLYRSAGLYIMHSGGLAVGPAPVGNVIQMAGMAPLR